MRLLDYALVACFAFGSALMAAADGAVLVGGVVGVAYVVGHNRGRVVMGKRKDRNNQGDHHE